MRRDRRRAAWLIALVACWPAAAQEQGGSTPAVAWRASGEARVRYETLENQFRAGATGGDQSFSTRALLRGDLTAGRIGAALELIDARGFLDDADSRQLSSIVNPLDVLEASVQVAVDGPGGSDVIVQGGRFGIAIGSNRFVASGDFGNQIRSFNGLRAKAAAPSGDTLEAFYTAPSERRPDDDDGERDNDVEADPIDEGLRLWGVHARRAALAPSRSERLSGEAFVIGFEEKDTPEDRTADRRLVDWGGRLLLAPEPGRWDGELEGAWRTGTARATDDPADIRDLDVSAGTLHASLGYTFDAGLVPRLALDADVATGDGDPADGTFSRYEHLYGSRRGDFGATSIMGPASRTNVIAVGGRLQVAPSPRWDARALYKAVYLADERDLWEEGELVDPTGASGRFVGHVVDGRARVWLIPERLQTELGAAVFLKGGFAESAPGAPDEGDTLYGFAQLTAFF